MNYKTCFDIAKYNLWQRKKSSFKTLLQLLVLSCLLVVWLILTSALKSAHDNYLYGASSQNYILFNLSVTQEGTIINDESYKLLKEAENLEHTRGSSALATLDIKSFIGKEDWSFVNIKHISLSFNGKDYQGVNDYSYYFEQNFDRREYQSTYSVPFRIGAIYSDSFYTENEMKEFNYKTNNSSVMLYGKENIDEKEIIISDYILSKFGITDNPENLLGQTISFYCDGKALLENYTVAGIINSDLFHTKSMIANPQIYVRSTPELNKLYNIDTVECHLDIDSYINTLKTMEQLEDKGYNMYIGAMEFASYYNVISGAQAIVSRLVGLFGGMICIAIILNLYNVLLTAAEEKKNCYGILKAIGMPGKSLYAIAYIEIFILTFIAVTAAGLISWWLLQLANQIMFSYIQIRLSISIEKYAVISLLTLLGISGLIFLIELPILKKMFSSQPAKLLR